MRAIDDAPRGLFEIAHKARDYGAARGNTGAGLLMHMIRLGEHFASELALAALHECPKEMRTGWRAVRGSHGQGWIQDALGTDSPSRPWSD